MNTVVVARALKKQSRWVGFVVMQGSLQGDGKTGSPRHAPIQARGVG